MAIREIIFRGFQPDENGSATITLNGKKIRGEWVYWNELGILSCEYWQEFSDWGIVIKYAHDMKIISETIGQFTGLTDTNGNRIFAGDILKQAEYMCNSRLGIVGYDSTAGVGIGFILYDQYGCRINSNEWDDFEIRGNIYEDAELLEVEQ